MLLAFVWLASAAGAPPTATVDSPVTAPQVVRAIRLARPVVVDGALLLEQVLEEGSSS